jgi:hypothetical protein
VVDDCVVVVALFVGDDVFDWVVVVLVFEYVGVEVVELRVVELRVVV